MNKQQLAARLWASANDLRGKMDASEYKNYILGFLFYKFLSEYQEQYFEDNGYSFEEIYQQSEAEQAESKAFIKEDLRYFIEEKDLYSTWIKNIKAFKWNISQVQEALNQFARKDNEQSHDRYSFAGIFSDVNLHSEKLGAGYGEKQDAVQALLQTLDSINITHNHDYDLFGFIYEYLIGQFAMSSGKKAGEFYTPQPVSTLMAKIVASELRDRDELHIYDPTMGSGSLLFAVGNQASSAQRPLEKFVFYGQEDNTTTYNIARMNLLMRGIKPDNIYLKNADTLRNDWPQDDTPLFVDAVVANPPYSAKWDAHSNRSKEPRFQGYDGIAPATKADYAFLLHSLYHLKPNGIMAIVLPHGVLFRGNEEEKIRRKLLERRQIDAVIGLPAGIFTNTGIPTIIMILRKVPKHDKVLFIDASQGFRKEKNSNVLRERDIKKILDIYQQRTEEAGYSHLADFAEIEQNNFNLNIPRYITPTQQGESHNIQAHLQGGIPSQDIEHFNLFWQQFPALKNKLFAPLRAGFVQLKVAEEAIFETIAEDADYQQAMQQIHQQIQHWQRQLASELLAETPLASGQIADKFCKFEQRLSQGFSQSPFTDKYEAYQIFADQWQQVIEADLDLLAEKGYLHARVLEPNMVLRGREEVQDGTKGALLDKTLLAKHFFSEEIEQLEQLKQELAQAEEAFAEHNNVEEDSALADCVIEEKLNLDSLLSELQLMLADLHQPALAQSVRHNLKLQQQAQQLLDLLTGQALSSPDFAPYFSKGKLSPKAFSQMEKRCQALGQGEEFEALNGLIQANNALKALKAEFKHQQKSLEALYKKQAEQTQSADEEWLEKYQLFSEVYQLSQSIKTLKAQIRAQEPVLAQKTEEKYPALSEAEIRELLAQKWFSTLTEALENITHSYSRELTAQLKALHQRYAETLDQIRQQREQAEKTFWAMAEELIGGAC